MAGQHMRQQRVIEKRLHNHVKPNVDQNNFTHLKGIPEYQKNRPADTVPQGVFVVK
jgi:hypothetical protein